MLWSGLIVGIGCRGKKCQWGRSFKLGEPRVFRFVKSEFQTFDVSASQSFRDDFGSCSVPVVVAIWKYSEIFVLWSKPSACGV